MPNTLLPNSGLLERYGQLRLILGDQLNASHAWYKQSSAEQENCLYVIAELPQEVDYVKHHAQKVLAFFAAMAQFAQALKKAGLSVLYLTLDETQHYQTLPQLLDAIMIQFTCKKFEYQQPDEYRLSEQLNQFQKQLNAQGIETRCCDTEHFLLPHYQLTEYFTADKKQRMETFYRKMRKRYGILMQGENPEGERWNFDSENRKKLTKKDLADIPQALSFSNDVSAIKTRLTQHKISCLGEFTPTLLWPINREQSLTLLDYFCRHCLPKFGLYQDAMTCKAKDNIEDKQWSLYHSRLAFALNTKMLQPLQVINKAIEHFRVNDDINLAQIEGFVRQILGWREFVRGVYWANMPKYQQLNHLKADNPLPKWFWSGDTKMNCLHHAITQSLDYAYAHHIQRLMVTGNFCLIAGIDPAEVDQWYLGIYIDAIEWVEMPNTRGMSQFADGGIVGSKPYAASGNYINKMSDYCSECHYDVKQKTTDNACPLNSLYWQFMIKHRDRLAKNPRIGMVYRNWDKQESATQQATLAKAEQVLENINTL